MAHDITLITSAQITDEIVKQLNADSESTYTDQEAVEGETVTDSSGFTAHTSPVFTPAETGDEKNLRSRIESGEWDNLDDLPAFTARTPEGQLMARTEAIDFRIQQLQQRLPMLLNQHLHDAYIQVLKKIGALRKTKGALFYYFYKNEGQRDLPGEE